LVMLCLGAGITAFGFTLLGLSKRWGYSFMFMGIIVIPLVWSVMTVLDPTPHTGLPSAFNGSWEEGPGRPPIDNDNYSDRLLIYLEENTADIEYLAAVPNAHVGSPIVLETGRPVLFLGGFSGGDPVVDVQELQEMVANGELKYVLYSSQTRSRQPEIFQWIENVCLVVPEFSQFQQIAGGPNAPGQQGDGNWKPGGGMILFDCGIGGG
ncbi:hypothetical protein ACFLYP_01380, partial [Chloroflexota bacterium]